MGVKKKLLRCVLGLNDRPLILFPGRERVRVALPRVRKHRRRKFELRRQEDPGKGDDQVIPEVTSSVRFCICRSDWGTFDPLSTSDLSSDSFKINTIFRVKGKPNKKLGDFIGIAASSPAALSSVSLGNLNNPVSTATR